MSLTVQTNIASLIAQNNLSLNSNFMTQTITRLTSGYRINSSADDAAGLVIANEYRSNITELTQGVRNANDGISTLQIVDGGLNNISTMLDRMKTLATQSASGTFTGNRGTLDQEYQQLLGEISRQAGNIGLAAGGTHNTTINVYIGGGGNSQANSQVTVDLSGKGNQVDSAGLGLSATNLLSAGTDFGSINLNAGGNVLASASNGGVNTQTLTFNLAGGQQVTATLQATTSAGITAQQAVDQLNSTISAYGLNASINAGTGFLQVSGTAAFTATAAAATAGGGVVAAADKVTNGTLYTVDGSAANGTPTVGLNLSSALVAATKQENLVFTEGGSTVNVALTNNNAGTVAQGLQTLNSALQPLGISAVLGKDGSISFQGGSTFSVAVTDPSDAGVYAATAGSNVSNTAASPTVTGGLTTNALNAITSINNAIAALGNVQGTVGAGENKLNYAIGLANSQVTSFSAAQSRIRDADMASEAANLTKAQILEQSSIAAMAQANSAPQAVLALLK
jgi:flagellin